MPDGPPGSAAAAPAAGGQPEARAAAAALRRDVEDLRSTILREAAPLLARLGRADCPSIANLAHYLALRRHDIRPLQRRLMAHGLSSLGRLESRVLPTLEAVSTALAPHAGEAAALPLPSPDAFFAGEARLAAAADALFGSPPLGRRSRIMVTLPREAATMPEFVVSLAASGMDIARINCAHDDAERWQAMAAHVRAAGDRIGRRLTVLMDIAGPKIRTGAMPGDRKLPKLHPGDSFLLLADLFRPPPDDPPAPLAITLSPADLIDRLRPGDRFGYDDGKLDGVVESVGDGVARLRVRHAKQGGTRLKPEKGLNLPDTDLGLSPLTAKDEEDLATVIACADMIGYSFVSRADDLDLLEAAIARHPGRDRPLGLVAKIERPEAVRNLPDLIARAAGRRPFGVMIARGDLAAEIGFERLAEMQEELLWLCEAAAVPAIWATQVLEDLVKHGVPSRGEMTDAAMAARAECVMLNKGPEIEAAIGLLDRLLARMDAHAFKKTPTLRALKSW